MNINRISILASAALAALVLPLSLHAYTEVVNGIEWTYDVSGGKASISGANPASGNITIPATLGGYPVTAIWPYTFSGCSGLMSVTIPPPLPPDARPRRLRLERPSMRRWPGSSTGESRRTRPPGPPTAWNAPPATPSAPLRQ